MRISANEDPQLVIGLNAEDDFGVAAPLYVPNDSNGIEKNASGQIIWRLPAGGVAAVTEVDRLLVLRRPEALLHVLDERIYRAESLQDVKVTPDGTAPVSAARLLLRTC